MDITAAAVGSGGVKQLLRDLTKTLDVLQCVLRAVGVHGMQIPEKAQTARSAQF